MKKARVILVLGIWITTLPYLGFPYSWKDILITLSGLGLVYTSFMLYKEYKIKEIKKEKIFDNFKENGDFNQNENQNENEVEIVKQEPEEHTKLHKKEI